MKTRTITLVIEVGMRDELDDEDAAHGLWQKLDEADLRDLGLEILGLVGTGRLPPEKGEMDETDPS